MEDGGDIFIAATWGEWTHKNCKPFVELLSRKYVLWMKFRLCRKRKLFMTFPHQQNDFKTETIFFFKHTWHKWSEMMNLFVSSIYLVHLVSTQPGVNGKIERCMKRRKGKMDGQQQRYPFESQETANQFIFPRILWMVKNLAERYWNVTIRAA